MSVELDSRACFGSYLILGVGLFRPHHNYARQVEDTVEILLEAKNEEWISGLKDAPGTTY
jgi:hypothetical protein